jgi:hypothetical protein
MVWLKQAVVTGYKYVAHMKQDMDLDSLPDLSRQPCPAICPGAGALVAQTVACTIAATGVIILVAFTREVPLWARRVSPILERSGEL